MELQSKLSKIQQELKANKSQHNDFGNYDYRSCEDILKAVKPLLNGCIITISDEIILIGDRYYVKATATISHSGESIPVNAFAREPLSKKGMDEAQITGATSSYARKYSLNGLLLIDDTKDADTMKPEKKEVKPEPEPKQPSRVVDNLPHPEPTFEEPTTKVVPVNITEAQMKYITKLWAEKGNKPEALDDFVIDNFELGLIQISKSQASQLIDKIK